jgi:hypothetical protein
MHESGFSRAANGFLAFAGRAPSAAARNVHPCPDVMPIAPPSRRLFAPL